jgi:hypothetical protein
MARSTRGAHALDHHAGRFHSGRIGRRRLRPAWIRREGLHHENAVAIERVSDRGPGQRHDLLGRARDDVHIGEHPGPKLPFLVVNLAPHQNVAAILGSDFVRCVTGPALAGRGVERRGYPSCFRARLAAISRRMPANRFRGMAAPAIWNAT